KANKQQLVGQRPPSSIDSTGAKACNEIEQPTNDDGYMAEMYLTDKKQRNLCTDLYDEVQGSGFIGPEVGLGFVSVPIPSMVSKSGAHKL
nr:magnesium transporter MRS2-5 [Tanacetum cinerariifolium]